ncbi:MAG: acylphosphatase [Candidatus Diapherotrites archaeon]|nr:acylphosphatase [Candidatus Diapherotrites archaeon]
MRQVNGKVIGTVQGVSFRQFAFMHAQELNIRGWVKNAQDGSVEFCAQGEIMAIQKWLKTLQVGPPASEVERIEVKWNPPKEEFTEFSVIH